jgi:hypothetical protein
MTEIAPDKIHCIVIHDCCYFHRASADDDDDDDDGGVHLSHSSLLRCGLTAADGNETDAIRLDDRNATSDIVSVSLFVKSMIYQIEEIINDLPFLSCLSMQRAAGTWPLSPSLYIRSNTKTTQVNRTFAEPIMIDNHFSTCSDSMRSSDTPFCLESLVVLYDARIERHRLETPFNEAPSDHRRVGRQG